MTDYAAGRAHGDLGLRSEKTRFLAGRGLDPGGARQDGAMPWLQPRFDIIPHAAQTIGNRTCIPAGPTRNHRR